LIWRLLQDSITHLTTVSFDSPAAPSTVQVPSGVMTQGTNTLRVEFAGPSPQTLVDDSTIGIKEEIPR